MSNIIKKLLYASIILVMVLSTGLNTATAQGPAPTTHESISKASISLAGVESYYGLLSQRSGTIKVIVELSDTAGIQYQAALDSSGLKAVNQTKAQLNRIQQAQTSFLQSVQAAGIETTEIYRVQRVYNGVALAIDSKQAEALAQMDGIKAIYPLISKTLDHTTSVPLINAPRVWGGTTAYQGDGIKIGVIDTGIDYLHTNFGGPGTGYDVSDFTSLADGGFPTAKVVGGWDFVGDDYDAAGSGAQLIPVPDPDPMDCNGHGSHVSGSAAGYGVNKDGTTFTGDYATLQDLPAYPAADSYINKFRIGPGVAPKASLYALRVFGCEGSTDVTDVAVEWAVDPNGDGNFEDHLDVINLSLGSSFGSEYDSSAMAVNNAALAGVIVVTSSGNSGDVNYITGAPGLARYAISVANTNDASSVIGGFDVTAPAGIAGTYPATEATWGANLAVTGPLTGDLVASVPVRGCTAFTNAAAMVGKIALVERGDCNFTVKAKNAQLAGAYGVLIYNNAPGDPITLGGADATITIPAMMTTQSVGNLLKTTLATDPVTVKLTAEYRDTIINVDPTQNDKVVASSSRGLRRADSGLKPDLSAPGNTIYSTATGTGNQGLSLGGTSMASPHVAGVMALLRQEHPGWSVEQLKARVMNTATHDLFVGDEQTGNRFTPSRIGAGRVDALNAVAPDQVILYNKTDPGAVSVSFGVLEVVETTSGADLVTSKTVTIENLGSAPATYDVGMNIVGSTPVTYYQSNTGVTFTLLDAAGAPLVNPVTINAGSSLDIQVQLSIDSSLLQRRRDLTMVAGDALGGGRQYMTETGGYLTLTVPVVGPSKPFSQSLRLPVHASPRPASDLKSAVSQITLPSAPTGSFVLPTTGARIAQSTDYARTAVLELKGISPNEPETVGINNNADLQYVGVMADNPAYYAFNDLWVYFGLSTYGEWSTPTYHEVEFDIYIDADEDGTPDHLVMNANISAFTGTIDDSFIAIYCPYPVTNIAAQCDLVTWLNNYSGSTNVNPFNSSVMMLPVSATGIGLSADNTDFNFFVASFNREGVGVQDVTDWMSYDLGKMVIDTNDYNITGFPMHRLSGANEIIVNYDKNNLYADAVPQGLLLLHYQNTTGKMAEVVNFVYPTATLTPEVDSVSIRPAGSLPVKVDLTNPSAQNCTFDLNYTSDQGLTVYGPAAWYVPAMGTDSFTVTVNVPAGAVQGSADVITVAASCREQTRIASAAFGVNILYQQLMPFISSFEPFN